MFCPIFSSLPLRTNPCAVELMRVRPSRLVVVTTTLYTGSDWDYDCVTYKNKALSDVELWNVVLTRLQLVEGRKLYIRWAYSAPEVQSALD